MRFPWFCHKLAQSVYYKSDVRSCDGQVKQPAYKPSILTWIIKQLTFILVEFQGMIHGTLASLHPSKPTSSNISRAYFL